MDTVEVVVAVIGRAHGVRGELTLTVRTDEPDRRLRKGVRLRASDPDRSFVVESARWVSGRLVVTLGGVADRNAAVVLRVTVLFADVPRDERPEDSEEFYDRQLIGMAVELADQRRVGVVSDVLHLPAQDVLSVRTDAGERLVPFVRELVPHVDAEAGVVRLADVPGLVDDRAIDDGSNTGSKQ